MMGAEAKHKLDYKNDYIEKPKASGYRGVHLIYRYHRACCTNPLTPRY